MFGRRVVNLCCMFVLVVNALHREAAAGEIKVAFWNVENLFDEYVDRRAPEEDLFLREDVQEKLRKDAAIIRELDADIVGLMEVENRAVLRELCRNHLADAGYQYFSVVEETDRRGIDVALISRVPHLAYSFDVPDFYRGILVGRFSFSGEPLYVIVNHWKSRFDGGADLRMNCAKCVAELARQVIPAYEGRSVPVIIGGDFNDDDTDASVRFLEMSGFFNTLRHLPAGERWTLPFNDVRNRRVVYNGFDHVFVNPQLQQGTAIRWTASEVVRPSVMIGQRVIDGQSYTWPDDDDRDHIGYSDHFPVAARLRVPGPDPAP